MVDDKTWLEVGVPAYPIGVVWRWSHDSVEFLCTDIGKPFSLWTWLCAERHERETVLQADEKRRRKTPGHNQEICERSVHKQDEDVHVTLSCLQALTKTRQVVSNVAGCVYYEHLNHSSSIINSNLELAVSWSSIRHQTPALKPPIARHDLFISN